MSSCSKSYIFHTHTHRGSYTLESQTWSSVPCKHLTFSHVNLLHLNLKKYDHITLGLKKLHWLPVKERIEYKFILIVFKALNGNESPYMQSMLELYNPARQLRSSSKQFVLKEKNAKLVTMGDRAFSVSAPRLWNNLPNNIRNLNLKINDFKSKLKKILVQA